MDLPSKKQQKNIYLIYCFLQTGVIIQMPVPSSYNDITNEKSLRDFVGWVWYDREFYVPKAWQTERVVMRFGSAHYYAVVVSRS